MVVVVGETVGQFGQFDRVVIFGFVRSVLDLVHERVGIGQQILDADKVFLLLFVLFECSYAGMVL